MMEVGTNPIWMFPKKKLRLSGYFDSFNEKADQISLHLQKYSTSPRVWMWRFWNNIHITLNMQTTNTSFLVLINTPGMQGTSTSNSFLYRYKEMWIGGGIYKRTSCSECWHALDFYSHMKMNLAWFITKQWWNYIWVSRKIFHLLLCCYSWAVLEKWVQNGS